MNTEKRNVVLIVPHPLLSTHYLGVQRKKQAAQGLEVYGLVGGKCDEVSLGWVEPDFLAMVREAREEVDIEVLSHHVFAETFSAIDDSNNRTTAFFLRPVLPNKYANMPVDQSFMGPEGLLLKWCTRAELAKSYPKFQGQAFAVYDQLVEDEYPAE